MPRILFLMLLAAPLLSAATINVNPNPPVNAAAILDSITGADMAGLLVTATFLNPGSPPVAFTAAWASTGPTSGAAVSGSSPALNFSVSVAGNTSGILVWQYTSLRLSPVLSLAFDGTAAGIYFDRTSPNPGSLGSGPGADIVLSPGAVDSQASVTYSSAVSVAGNLAQNDLYAQMLISFGPNGLNPTDFSFTQDTDRAAPEPATLLTMAAAVAGLGLSRRRAMYKQRLRMPGRAA